MSSFFTIPYIAFLGFILLLITGVYIFLVKRMANQNHQFSSIVGVVTSLADELNRLKEFISTTLINKPKEIQLTQNELIHVSDDEDDDDTEDETDDDDESDDEEEDEIASNLIIESTDDVRYIQMIPTVKDQAVKEEVVKEEVVKDQAQIVKEEVVKVAEEKDTTLETIDNDSIHDITISLTNDISLTNLTNDEDNVEETDQNVDYKKLTLNKLRSLIVEKGLVEDASKLKKPALLQLLEQHN